MGAATVGADVSRGTQKTHLLINVRTAWGFLTVRP